MFGPIWAIGSASGGGVDATKIPLTYMDTDGTLAANSDVKLATQKAAKTYSDTKVAKTDIDTDVTLAANSDVRVPSQKAIKAYADQLIATANAVVYKGVIDCSGNPNYPAADAGWFYAISVAGKIGGASGVAVEAGDFIICNTDGTASGNQATVGANWNSIQKNLDGIVIGPASAADGGIAFYDSVTGKLIGTDPLLFWNKTSKRLGVNLAVPNEPLEVSGRTFIGDGGGASRIGFLLIPNQGGTYAHLQAYNYGTSSGRTMALNPLGGAVMVGGASPLTSAVFQVDSTTKLNYVPRMTTTQINAVTSPSAAGEAYDSTLNKKKIYNGTAYETVLSSPSITGNRHISYDVNGSPVSHEISKSHMLFDDFICNAAGGELGWTTTSSGSGAGATGATTGIDATNTAIGVVQLSTGTISTGRCTLNLGADRILFGYASYSLEMRIGTDNNLSDGTDTYAVRVGFFDTTGAGDAVDGAYFEYDSTSSTFWRYCTSSNSARTKNNSTVTVSASSWYKLRIEVNAAGTNVDFYINGTLAGSITTNIPTGSSRYTGVAFKVEKSLGITARLAYIDYCQYIHTLTTAR